MIPLSAPMARAPFRPGTSHVMELGPIGIDDAGKQCLASRDDVPDAQGKGRPCVLAGHDATSLVQLAEDGGERERKNLLAELVGSVEHPAAPIFRAGHHDIGADDAMRVLAGLDKVFDGDAALCGKFVFLISAMEIDVRHVGTP